ELPGSSRLTFGLAACGIKLAEKRKLETTGSKPIDMLSLLNAFKSILVNRQRFLECFAIPFCQTWRLLLEDLLDNCRFWRLLARVSNKGIDGDLKKVVKNPAPPPVAIQEFLGMAAPKERQPPPVFDRDIDEVFTIPAGFLEHGQQIIPDGKFPVVRVTTELQFLQTGDDAARVGRGSIESGAQLCLVRRLPEGQLFLSFRPKSGIDLLDDGQGQGSAIGIVADEYG